MDDVLRGLHMKAKPTLLATENDLSVDLTLHDVPASLISEFVEKIVRPYYNGNLNVAIQDLIKKAIVEQDFILSHITHVRNSVEP
jgi:tagatose-1,6-bisphosphate aldolase non-catalytic subunit AgaZ/GatZ